MTRAAVGSFATRERFLAALREAHGEGRAIHDAYAPMQIEGLEAFLGRHTGNIRRISVISGLGVAAALYLLQYASLLYSYAFNSGNRPLNSWPVLLLAPFEVGVFAAAFAGLVTFLIRTGLPRLNHPLFEIDAFERVTQDRFFLALEATDDDEERDALAWLHASGVEQAWAVTL